MNSLKIVITLFILVGFHLFSSGQITPQEAILQIQKGINLGNTFEPPTEGGWNNPKPQEYYFDMYREEGFQLVRIPVRWDNYTLKSAPYTVSKTYLDRIEQVVDWGLERGLFILINSHHDNWIKDAHTTENKARFDSIWTQISLRFKDKSEKLFFEVLNEPHGLSKINNDEMHARVLSIIRQSNPTRIVIFQGNNWGSSEDLLNAAIPNDNYLIGSFHSYDPYLFGLKGEGTWGSSADHTILDNKFKSVSEWSKENNIPVFVGEFGAIKTGDFTSRMKHYRAYVTLIQKYGFAGAAWDDGGDFRIMERQQHGWNEIKDVLLKTTAKSPVPAIEVFQDSIVRVQWQNQVFDHDSILIQRKLASQNRFVNIAVLPPDTNSFYDIKPPMIKTYQYRIIAHYKDTSDLYSQPYQVYFPFWEKKVKSPFSDTLVTVPGVIEAEHFDFGGEGLSYHDADHINTPGDFRPDEGVDIYSRLGEGYHIGNALAGEWYEYSFRAKTDGWYSINSHVAALFGGGTFQLCVDTIFSEVLTAPTCYSWLNTKPVSTRMYLSEGKHVMRFSVLSDPLFNIDKIVFDLETASGTVPFEKDSPFLAYQNNLGQLTIKNIGDRQIERLSVYSVSGKLILSVRNPASEISIPDYKTPAGIYIIQGISKQRKYSEKIIVK